MSFFARLKGSVQYKDAEVFNEVVRVLQQGGWVDNDGYFVNEFQERLSEEPDIDIEKRVIVIPHYFYENLTRVEFFRAGAIGVVVGTSTDGCFDGWIIEDGERRDFDLAEWAKKNGLLQNDVDDDEWMQSVEDEVFVKYA